MPSSLAANVVSGALQSADDFARAVADIPALVVACVKVAVLCATDGGLSRLSVVRRRLDLRGR